ncbi:MAG: hypothetical protein F6J89_02280 [Symploca sp. SIO1C4]|uniref:Uncharacterized protein n=1 Tax=Symploca sp. SIO1C4 TaxID=2607765 RepID=A0A6B3N047_9CYAN|nr:hypothetical protein [Symploca sp. SIO1C4]NET03651.1 hypothetical protein [Symploca sp. SIO2B6]
MKSKVSVENIRRLKAVARTLARRGDTTLARRLAKTVQVLEQKARETAITSHVN